MSEDMTDDLEHLEMLRDSTFRDITDMVAGHLGIDFERDSGPEPAKDEQKAEQRAQMIIDQWEEALMKDTPREPNTPLEKLLQGYHEICEKILDIRDDDLQRKHRRGCS